MTSIIIVDVVCKVLPAAAWCRWPSCFLINSSGRNSPVSLNFVSETERELTSVVVS
jgi:hypothetical protein